MLFSEILKIRGFDTSNIKLVRHTINRDYIKRIIDSGHFDLYQSIQKAGVFKGAKYFASFTDLQGTKALLYGIYRINGMQIIKHIPDEISFIMEPEEWVGSNFYKYNIEKDNSLADLEDRLVIDWGKATLSWHQKKIDKEVIEILPKGFFRPFPGYQNVVLSFNDLSKIVQNPDANRQWKMMLSNVFGVYLILDIKDGKQYVGSAYGKEGIWGRWSSYVQSKHGNNKILIDLLNSEPDRYKYFQFSILNILPNSSMKEQVVQLELITKDKLGSKAFGLNAN